MFSYYSINICVNYDTALNNILSVETTTMLHKHYCTPPLFSYYEQPIPSTTTNTVQVYKIHKSFTFYILISICVYYKILNICCLSGI